MIISRCGLNCITWSYQSQLPIIKWLVNVLYTQQTSQLLKNILEQTTNLAQKHEQTNEEDFIKYCYLAAHPTPLSYFKNEYISFDRIVELEKKTKGVLVLIKANAASCRICFVDVINGINFISDVAINKLHNFIDKTKAPIVIGHEDYDMKQGSLSGLNKRLLEDHYIFIDIPYIYSRDYIHEHCPDDAPIIATQMDNYSCHWFIKTRNNGIIIQPMSFHAVKLLVDDFYSGKKRFNFIQANDNGFDDYFCPTEEALLTHYRVLCAMWQVKEQTELFLTKTTVERINLNFYNM